jgi:hypothetical protein
MGILGSIFANVFNEKQYQVLYKLNSSSSWARAYSGTSESTAFTYAEREKSKGRYAVRIVDPKGSTIYSS